MSKKKITRISAIEPYFENILVCNNKNLRPFIEILVQEPENVAQESLGTLLGIFEISNDNEDSSYIVNYLISTIKKEYFSKPKRGAIESFEAALHKANLALSKLAEHENISWIGKLNAIIAAIEKNNIHLTKSGLAAAFLLRAKSMTDVSEGLASEDPEPHPLKTFTNVASGRLEKNDKLIISSNAIFDIFSFDEIKKSALRFSEEKFIQFLKTALGNELEKAAVLVVNIKERSFEPPIVQKPADEEIRAFSQNTFANAQKTSAPEERIKEEIAENKTSAAAQKNGHIYIREGGDKIEMAKTPAYWPEIKFWLHENIFPFFKTLFSFSWIKRLPSPKNKLNLPELEEIELPEEKIQAETENALPTEASGTIKQSSDFSKKLFAKFAGASIKGSPTKIRALFMSGAKKILPSGEKIKGLAAKLTYEQKIYAIIIILSIIIAPLFALKMHNRAKSQPEETAAAPAILPIALENDKNVIRVENVRIVLSDKNLSAPVNLNGKIFAVAGAKIIDLEKNESFEMPGDFSPAAIAIAMDDLNFIFLINKNNRIINFSPISKKFQENAISFPENTNLANAETYLTYLYAADANSGQIYRYPRSTGGFGEKANWLKDSFAMENVSGMAIDENIYLATGEQLLKFFRGSKVEFQPEQSATAIKFHKVFTNADIQNIYILDGLNGRIVKYNKNGEIISQHYNEKIKGSSAFTISEAAGKAYFAAGEDLIEMEI